MPKYSHMFTLAFEIESDDEEGEDITQEQFAKALWKRINELMANNEMLQAIGGPDNTHIVEKE